MSTAIPPKETDRVLRPVTNTYAIMHGEVYDYYSIKLGESKGKFVELLKLPPCLEEGYITINKKLYFVTFKDLLRGRVNVEREFSTTATGDGQPITTIVVDQNNSVDNQSGLNQSTELQEGEHADLAWQEQINALLHLDDPEEEWSFTTFA